MRIKKILLPLLIVLIAMASLATITTNPSRNEYTATGGQTIFNYTFRIYEDTDLNVYITPSGQDPDDSVDITTAYTVAGVDDPAGGSITLNVGATLNDAVTIVSNIPTSRTIDYQFNGDFRPDVVNADFDKSISLTKQADDLNARSLAFPQSSQVGTKILPAPEALKVIGYDSSLDMIMYDNPGQASIDAAASAAAALVSETNAATSETNAATSETNAAQSASDAQAAVGSVKVTANDTTADNLSTKLVNASTVINPGGNETLRLNSSTTTATGVVELATNSETIARADTTRAVTSAGLGAAIPADAVTKAWVTFDGTGVLSIADSFNVTSVTDNGTGDYTVNFTTAFANTSYTYVYGLRADDDTPSTASNKIQVLNSDIKTTSSFQFHTTVSASFSDSGEICLMFIGDQ